MQPTTIITGNLTSEPELRYLDSSRAVANFSIAHNPRHLDEATGEWVDGTPTFLRAELWGPAAENAAISLGSGTRVLAVGTLRTRRWTSAEGERRQAMSLVVDEIGPTLRWATTTVTRTGTIDAGETAGEDDQPPM